MRNKNNFNTLTVALIGCDGSGKSTISERLLYESPLPVRRIYMGINRRESNLALPTTVFMKWLDVKRGKAHQGGPRDTEQEANTKSSNPLKRFLKEIKSSLLLFNLLADECFRHLAAWYFKRRGNLVIFDRDFYLDYYHFVLNKDDRNWRDRVHGYFLQHLYPKPDVVIFLDAPAEVLFARKAEGTLPLLEQRRQDYLSLKQAVPDFKVVDAAQAVDRVFDDVLRLIMKRAQKTSASDVKVSNG